MPHFYKDKGIKVENGKFMCQCPHGLMPHFYENIDTAFRRCFGRCQCPLGLVPHFYLYSVRFDGDLEIVSMPSRAVTSFLLPDSERRFITTVCVSMPSRAVTSFLPHYECDTYAGTTLCVNALSGCYLISTSK